MARTKARVEELVREDPEMRSAIERVMAAANGGTVDWGDVSDDLTSGQWGRLIEQGVLEDADGDGFRIADRDGVEAGLSEDVDVDEDSEESSWSTYDKLAGLGAIGMFAGYSIPSVRNAIGSLLDVLIGPIEAALPFYAVILVLSLFTGLYSTLLQANLMDMDKMSEYQSQMQEIQDRRKAAKERGDDEALEEIQEEQMAAMGDQMGMFKEQFRPMVWIMLLTIPVFLWMYWMIRTQTLVPTSIVFPIAGKIGWEQGVVGPIQAWIVWYFVCSMGFTQVIRKALNIQTTPT